MCSPMRLTRPEEFFLCVSSFFPEKEVDEKGELAFFFFSSLCALR